MNCVSLNLNMKNNKKIYTLVICYDEDLDVIEWVEESICRDEELPDNIYETKNLKEFGKYLKNLPKLTEVGEA